MVTTRGRSASTLVEQPQLSSPHKHQANGNHHVSPVGKNVSHQATESKQRKTRNNTTSHVSSTNTTPEAKRRRTDSGSSSPVLNRSSPLAESHAQPKSIDENGAVEEAPAQTAEKDVPMTGDTANEAKQEVEPIAESTEETLFPVTTPPPESLSEDRVPISSEEAPGEEDIFTQAAKAAAEAALLGFSQSETPSILALHDQPSNTTPTLPESQPPRISTAVEHGANIIISTANRPISQSNQQIPSPHRSFNNPQNQVSSVYATPPGQLQPTAVLYEAARRVANSKSTSNPRNPATSASQRRPWTLEEERALMDGIDQVKGPHWSQVLMLYGPGGSINEILKDRTQVQLKDKARNLKLFFLKSNIEVPYYLSFVTGDLKSRTPGHGTAGADTTSQSATSSQNRQLNGSSPSAPVAGQSRTRYPPASIAQPTTTTAFTPLLSFTSSNAVYSSPYAPIGDALNGFPPNDNQESSMDKTPSQQDVADLASSAAAQVAAALANFNGLELPGLDLSASLGLKVDPIESESTVQFTTAEPDSQKADNATTNVMNIDSSEHTPSSHHSSTIETGTLPEGIKTFDTH